MLCYAGLTPYVFRLCNYNMLMVFMQACSLFFFGGDERIRTADPLLARQVLSQLSYTPMIIKWWAQVDSNHRPHAYQACALTN